MHSDADTRRLLARTRRQIRAEKRAAQVFIPAQDIRPGQEIILTDGYLLTVESVEVAGEVVTIRCVPTISGRVTIRRRTGETLPVWMPEVRQ